MPKSTPDVEVTDSIPEVDVEESPKVSKKLRQKSSTKKQEVSPKKTTVEESNGATNGNSFITPPPTPRAFEKPVSRSSKRISFGRDQAQGMLISNERSGIKT